MLALYAALLPPCILYTPRLLYAWLDVACQTVEIDRLYTLFDCSADGAFASQLLPEIEVLSCSATSRGSWLLPPGSCSVEHALCCFCVLGGVVMLLQHLRL